MNEKRLAVTIRLDICDAETGEPFASTEQNWASMSLKSVVGIERVLHRAQDELLTWSENDLVSV